MVSQHRKMTPSYIGDGPILSTNFFILGLTNYKGNQIMSMVAKFHIRQSAHRMKWMNILPYDLSCYLAYLLWLTNLNPGGLIPDWFQPFLTFWLHLSHSHDAEVINLACVIFQHRADRWNILYKISHPSNSDQHQQEKHRKDKQRIQLPPWLELSDLRRWKSSVRRIFEGGWLEPGRFFVAQLYVIATRYPWLAPFQTLLTGNLPPRGPHRTVYERFCSQTQHQH